MPRCDSYLEGIPMRISRRYQPLDFDPELDPLPNIVPVEVLLKQHEVDFSEEFASLFIAERRSEEICQEAEDVRKRMELKEEEDQKKREEDARIQEEELRKEEEEHMNRFQESLERKQKQVTTSLTSSLDETSTEMTEVSVTDQVVPKTDESKILQPSPVASTSSSVPSRPPPPIPLPPPHLQPLPFVGPITLDGASTNQGSEPREHSPPPSEGHVIPPTNYGPPQIPMRPPSYPPVNGHPFYQPYPNSTYLPPSYSIPLIPLQMSNGGANGSASTTPNDGDPKAVSSTTSSSSSLPAGGSKKQSNQNDLDPVVGTNPFDDALLSCIDEKKELSSVFQSPHPPTNHPGLNNNLTSSTSTNGFLPLQSSSHHHPHPPQHGTASLPPNMSYFAPPHPYMNQPMSQSHHPIPTYPSHPPPPPPHLSSSTPFSRPSNQPSPIPPPPPSSFPQMSNPFDFKP